MPEIKKEPEPTVKRVVGVLSALYFTQDVDELTGNNIRRVLVATFGQEIDLPDSEVKRLERNGALLPEGSSPEDAQRRHEALVDAYRGQRGDQEAMVRHQQRLASASGDIADVDADVDQAPVHELANWITEQKPTVDETVALADGDPRKAAKVLEAERLATGNSPRVGVEAPLQKLIDG